MNDDYNEAMKSFRQAVEATEPEATSANIYNAVEKLCTPYTTSPEELKALMDRLRHELELGLKKRKEATT